MKYNLRKTVLIGAISIYLVVCANAVTIYDADWTRKEVIILEWGDTYSTGPYTVLAEDFDKQANQSIITIHKDNEEIHTAIMSAGDTIVVSTIKITINEIGGCAGEIEIPYAKMTIYTMKPPGITINVNNEMTSDGLSNITIGMENSGGIRFSMIDLIITLPDDLTVFKDINKKYRTSFDTVFVTPEGTILTSNLENISAGSKEIRRVSVEVPALPERIEIPISVVARGIDLENKSYGVSKDANIIIEPTIKVRKIPLHTLENNDEDQFYINDRIYVTITVYNTATTDASDISLDETLMTSNFVMDPDTKLDWTFNLPARKSESFYYCMRAIRPGEVKISTTKVSREYKGNLYTSSLDSTTAKIYGTYFKISKTVDKNTAVSGDTVVVTVEAKNTGNHAGYLSLTDEIPAFAEFISGTVNTSAIVKPGDTISISYLLKIMDKGDFRFPSAIGKYKERHYDGIAYSIRPQIHVSESIPSPTTTEPIEIEETTDETNGSENNKKNTIPGFGFEFVFLIIIIFHLLKR